MPGAAERVAGPRSVLTHASAARTAALPMGVPGALSAQAAGGWQARSASGRSSLGTEATRASRAHLVPGLQAYGGSLSSLLFSTTPGAPRVVLAGGRPVRSVAIFVFQARALPFSSVQSPPPPMVPFRSSSTPLPRSRSFRGAARVGVVAVGRPGTLAVTVVVPGSRPASAPASRGKPQPQVP